MSAEHTSGLYLLIAVISVVLNAVLICKVFYQKSEIKDLLNRRQNQNHINEFTEENCIGRACEKFCKLERDVIPDLRNDVEQWRAMYIEEQRINSILNSTNGKLRMKNQEEKNND